MKNFYKTFTFMISFMILLVFINMGFGAKFTEKFLWLVLASMIVMNTDTLSELTEGLSNPIKEEKEETEKTATDSTATV